MDSIGVALRTEREKRGLSVEEAHESTKITVQNISALEEDRFDSFPNKVYARAFLRDYANFLGLDSSVLLTDYEDKWSPKAVPVSVPVKRPGSFWRVMGYTVLTIVIAAGLGAGGYFGWEKLERDRKIETEARVVDPGIAEPDTATIPDTPPVASPMPDTPKDPVAPPKPPPPVVAPQMQTLEMSAIRDVWVRVKVNGKTVFNKLLLKGQVKTFQGDSINIRSGMAGAVQLKLNGQLLPSLGSMKTVGDRTFTKPLASAPAPAPPVSAPSTPVPVP